METQCEADPSILDLVTLIQEYLHIPFEVCGLADTTGNLYVVHNVARDKRNNFVMDKGEYFQVLNLIKRSGASPYLIWHTHPFHPAIPSETDLNSQRSIKLPYLIVAPSGHILVT